jgi:hypothetical protein
VSTIPDDDALSALQGFEERVFARLDDYLNKRFPMPIMHINQGKVSLYFGCYIK